MKDILSKYTERLTKREAKAIDDFIRERIPAWQTKIMLKFPFTVKLFGWEVIHRPMTTSEAYMGMRVELMRWNKPVGTLMITVKLPTKE